jgi:anti-anti-sigma factor
MLPENVELDQVGSRITVSIRASEITPGAMQQIVDECGERMRYNNARHFIFDLSEVRVLVSACLGVLVNFMQEVEHFRGRIVVAGCNQDVAFLFKVMHLDRVFGLYEDITDAAAAL